MVALDADDPHVLGSPRAARQVSHVDWGEGPYGINAVSVVAVSMAQRTLLLPGVAAEDAGHGPAAGTTGGQGGATGGAEGKERVATSSRTHSGKRMRARWSAFSKVVGNGDGAGGAESAVRLAVR